MMVLEGSFVGSCKSVGIPRLVWGHDRKGRGHCDLVCQGGGEGKMLVVVTVNE